MSTAPLPHPRHETGMALVIVLILTFFVMVSAQMLLLPSLVGRQQTLRSGQASNVAHAAEGGVDFALATLNATIPTGEAANLTALPGYFQPSGTNVWAYSDPANQYFFRAHYGPDIHLELTLRTPATIPVPGGSGRAAEYRIIRSHAQRFGVRKRLEAIAQVSYNQVLTYVPAFSRAITARGDVSTAGASSAIKSDSYDSSLGLYGGANIFENGGIHANGSLVSGGVYKGTVTAVGTVDSGVSVQGTGNTLETGAYPLDIPDAPAAPSPTHAPAYSVPGDIVPPAGSVADLGAVSVSGNASRVLTLHTGTYVCSSLRVIGDAAIRIANDGPVALYVTGDIDVGGAGIVNESQRPQNLRLIATDPTASVSIHGTSDFYGCLQAPANDVTLAGDGEFYGAVVADSVTLSGTHPIVHYDESLGLMYKELRQVRRPQRFQVLAVNVLTLE